MSNPVNFDDEEMPLSGGNVTPVVRVGSTVRRSVGAWSPTVHHFLQYLAQSDFAGAPRFLGIDAKGREILSYLPGDVGFFSYIYTTQALERAAQLLRRFHDVSVGYVQPSNALWQYSYPDTSRHEVICHNDFAPYNLVFANQLPYGLIDFDTAGPGPRLWDVAYAVYWFVPLYPQELAIARGLNDLDGSSKRLRLFCDAYGCPCTPFLLDTVEQRLEVLCRRIMRGAEQGEMAYQQMIATGHLVGYQQAIQNLRQCRPAFDSYLTSAS